MRKICRKCNLDRGFSEYYKHPQMPDGHLNICKECTKRRVKIHRENNGDKIRAYEKIRNQNPERIKYSRQNVKRWRAKNPIAYKAQTAVGNAVRAGKLTKKPCRFCGGKENLHAHHNDYINFLDVVWLCAMCHHRMHNDIPKTEGDNKNTK